MLLHPVSAQCRSAEGNRWGAVPTDAHGKRGTGDPEHAYDGATGEGTGLERGKDSQQDAAQEQQMAADRMTTGGADERAAEAAKISSGRDRDGRWKEQGTGFRGAQGADNQQRKDALQNA